MNMVPAYDEIGVKLSLFERLTDERPGVHEEPPASAGPPKTNSATASPTPPTVRNSAAPSNAPSPSSNPASRAPKPPSTNGSPTSPASTSTSRPNCSRARKHPRLLRRCCTVQGATKPDRGLNYGGPISLYPCGRISTCEQQICRLLKQYYAVYGLEWSDQVREVFLECNRRTSPLLNRRSPVLSGHGRRLRRAHAHCPLGKPERVPLAVFRLPGNEAPNDATCSQGSKPAGYTMNKLATSCGFVLYQARRTVPCISSGPTG